MDITAALHGLHAQLQTLVQALPQALLQALQQALPQALLQAADMRHLPDLVIAVLLLEMVLLLVWHHRTGAGLAPRALLPNLLAGLCLMLALRAALVGAHVAWLALALAGAGAAHGVDLRQRWHRAPAGAGSMH